MDETFHGETTNGKMMTFMTFRIVLIFENIIFYVSYY